MNITVLYGSVRSERQGIKAARFFVTKLQERGHEAVLIDPLEHPLPLLDKRYKEYQKAPSCSNVSRSSSGRRTPSWWCVRNTITACLRH